jgi:hypothetical protein
MVLCVPGMIAKQTPQTSEHRIEITAHSVGQNDLSLGITTQASLKTRSILK